MAMMWSDCLSVVLLSFLIAGGTTCLYFSVHTETAYEFVLGYEFQHAYKLPMEECVRNSTESKRPDLLPCDTLYRLPYATTSTLCHANQRNWYDDVVCNVHFIGESTAFILTTFQQPYSHDPQYWPTGPEWRDFIPNQTEPWMWPLAHRINTPLYRVLSSEQRCFNTSVEATNKCIDLFLQQGQENRGIAFSWGPWWWINDNYNSRRPSYEQRPWFMGPGLVIPLGCLVLWMMCCCCNHTHFAIEEYRKHRRLQRQTTGQATQPNQPMATSRQDDDGGGGVNPITTQASTTTTTADLAATTTPTTALLISSVNNANDDDPSLSGIPYSHFREH